MPLNLRQISSKLSPRGWIALGASLLVGVAFIILVMSLASAPSYTTLVAGQSAAQTDKITTALSTAGIQYQLQNNGTAVAVQTSQEGQANDVLASQGLGTGTGSSSQSFESLLGAQGLGESNQQADEVEQSALEQQLDQSLEQINGVNSATVLLTLPDQASNLFSGINNQPSASVLLNTNTTLDPSVAKAIATDVADGVGSGLTTSDVTITDQNGDELWPSSGVEATGQTTLQSEEESYNAEMADKANAYLTATIGPNKALVQVSGTLNPDSQSVASVTYAKKSTPYTSAVSKETLTGNGGVLGAAGNNATNNAATTYAGANSGKTKYNNNTTTTQNDVSKTVSQTKIPPGAVLGQTVAVLVNSTVPASDLPIIRSAVENAVGFDKKRGDKINIGRVAFAKPPAVVASSSTSSKMVSDLKYVAIGLGSILFLLFMSRLLRRREADEFAGRPTWLRELEYPRPLSELEAQTQMVDLEPPAVVQRLRSPVNLARQQVEELVDRDPERVAAQIRQWMTED